MDRLTLDRTNEVTRELFCAVGSPLVNLSSYETRHGRKYGVHFSASEKQTFCEGDQGLRDAVMNATMCDGKLIVAHRTLFTEKEWEYIKSIFLKEAH